MRRLYKIISLIIVFLLIFASCGDFDEEYSDWNDRSDSNKKTGTYAEPLLSAEVMPPDGVVIMDLMHFAGGEMRTKAGGNGGSFEGHRDDYDIVKAYIDLLCTEYAFELACEPYILEYVPNGMWMTGSYMLTFEYMLKYTGDGELSGEKLQPMHLDDTIEGDICISGSINGSSLDYGMYSIRDGITLFDFGYRYGSEKLDRTYAGESFTAGLEKSGKKFSTSDGRLEAEVGEAMVISDGEKETYTAVYQYDSKDNCQKIIIETTDGKKLAVIKLDLDHALKTEDTYSEFDFANRGKSNETYIEIHHASGKATPTIGMLEKMTAVSMRVMYASEKQETAVIYFCAEFKDAPNTVECLAAFKTDKDTAAETKSADGEYTVRKGKTIDIAGSIVVDGSGDSYTWEIISGDEYIELIDGEGDTITVKGIKKGEARIRMTHTYWKYDGVNVLTGDREYQQHTRHCEYVITVK